MASIFNRTCNLADDAQNGIDVSVPASDDLAAPVSPIENESDVIFPPNEALTSSGQAFSQRLPMAMQALASILAKYSNPQQTLYEALKTLSQLFQADFATLIQHVPETGMLQPMRPAYSTSPDDIPAVTELEAMRFRLTEPNLIAQIFTAGQPVFHNNLNQVSYIHLTQTDLQSVLAIPLRLDEKVVGLAILFNKSTGFEPQDLSDLMYLDGLLATLFKNYDLVNRLEQQERRHLAAVDAAVDGYIEVNPDMTITLFSKGAELLTGWQVDEALGQHCYDILKPHSPNNESLCTNCPLRRSFRSGTAITNVETLIRNRDGEDSWASCSYNSVTDTRGQIVSGMIAIKDIYSLKALSDELRQQSQQQESLLGVNNAINGLSNIEDIYRVSLETISRAINFDLGTIHSIDLETEELTLMTLLEKEDQKPSMALSIVNQIPSQGGQGVGLEDEEFERQTRLLQYRANQQQTYRAQDGKRISYNYPKHTLQECEALRENEPYMAVNLPGKATCGVINDFEGMQSHLCVPIKTQERSYGILHLASRKPYAFWGSDFVLALSVCKQIAVGAERARLFEEVDQLARTDPLTGLYNKRELWERLGREIRRAERRQSPLSLILIDLDRLKWINDCFGHMQGDFLLTRLSEVIREQCRASDVAFRYGGDELCLILPDTNQDEAKIAADRLRHTARDIRLGKESSDFVIGEETLVTMSVGIASYPQDAMTSSQLFECADAAMYRAKETGKDRTVIFDHEIDFNRLNYRRRSNPTDKDDRLTPPRPRTTGKLPPA